MRKKRIAGQQRKGGRISLNESKHHAGAGEEERRNRGKNGRMEEHGVPYSARVL